MTTFATRGPITLTVDVAGDVRITASDRNHTVVVVHPRTPGKAADVAVAEQTQIELDERLFAGASLVVRSPHRWLRSLLPGHPGLVDVTVEVPTGSRVDASTAVGDVVVDGELGECRLRSGMGALRVDHAASLWASTGFGNVTVDHVCGDLDVTTGSGAIRIGRVDGAAIVKSSNGNATVADVAGDLRLRSANGDVVVGRAGGSVTATTACGDVRVGDVSRGTVALKTAAGAVEVGVRQGSAAWLDLHTRFGKVRNHLDASDGPGATDLTVELRARTAAGDIVVRRAAAS